MKVLLRTYIVLGIILFASACTKEEARTIVDGGNPVRIELFTRLNSFDTPVSRASALEDDVDREPWILVFTDQDGSGVRENAKFADVAKTYISTNNKSYVYLKEQKKKSWILILANPENKFHIGSTAYDYTSANFTTQLNGKTLEQATSILLSKPIAYGGRVDAVPFIDLQLPMSYLEYVDLPGITNTTKIGTESSPLELVRTVAKITIKNDNTSNFTMQGITSVNNVSNSTTLHNLSGVPAAATDLVYYSTTDPNNVDFMAASNAGSDPIYVYESKASNTDPAFIIIKGNYKGLGTYFYKMALVDASLNPLDITRNHEYTFTIKTVKAPGYQSYYDALAAEPNNTVVDYSVKVTQLSAFETTATKDSFLAVSNRHFLIFDSDYSGNTYLAVTVITNLTADTESGTPYTNMITMSPWLELVSPADGKIRLASSPTTTATTNVSVKLKAPLPEATSGDWVWGDIILKLADYRVTIKIKKKPPVSNSAASVIDLSDEYYLLSANMEYESTESSPNDINSWIKFSTADNIYRYDLHNIMVDDGKININVSRGTGPSKYATLYLTTVNNPSGSDKENTPRRIKAFIRQEARVSR